jgi:hypothetical protein
MLRIDELPMRPLLFGYLNYWPAASEARRTAFSRALAAYAVTEGFALADIFVEHVGGRGAAFDALVHALQRDEARVVAVPALEHLTRVPGVPLARERLEGEGVRALVVVIPGKPEARSP